VLFADFRTNFGLIRLTITMMPAGRIKIPRAPEGKIIPAGLERSATFHEKFFSEFLSFSLNGLSNLLRITPD